MTRFLLTIAVLAFLAFGLPSPSSAQIDNFDYAMGLADRGYFDLARDVLDKIINDESLPKEERSIARLGLVGIVKRDADRETEGDAKLEKYREAEKGYEEFVSDPNNQDHPKFFDALFEYGELLQSKGEAISRLLDDEIRSGGTADRIAQLREEGTSAIRSAQEILQRAADYLEAIPEARRTEDQKTDLMKARFYKALNFYYVAQLYDSGTFERENSLKLAAQELEDYAWEYEGYPSGWWALLYVGKSYADWSLENAERQSEYASNALNYLEGILTRPETDRTLLDLPFFIRLVQQAFYEGAKLLNGLGRYPETVEYVARMEPLLVREDGSKIELGQWGYLARLEEINALEAMQELDKAIEVCTELAKRSEGIRGVGSLLAKKLASLIEKQNVSGGGEQKVIPPDILLQTAKGFYLQKDWFRAIEYFQRVLQSIHATGTGQEFAPEAWNYIGRALSQLKVDLGAGIAYEEGARKFEGVGDPKLNEDNWFKAYAAYGRQMKIEAAGKGGASDLVRKLRDDIRKELVAKFPGTDLVYYEAIEKMEEGDFEGAIVLFEKVEKASEILYPRSQAKIGECNMNIALAAIEENKGEPNRRSARFLERLDEIRAAFDEFCKDPNWQTGNTQATDERQQARAALDYFAAKGADASGEIEKALGLLKGFSSKYERQASFVEAALFLEVQVQLKGGNLAEAEARAAELDSKFPASTVTSAAYLLIGQEYKNRFKVIAEEYAKTNNMDAAQAESTLIQSDEKARETLLKSSRFVEIWWDKTGKPFAKGLEIGRDFFRLRGFEDALRILEFLYKRDADNREIPSDQRRALKFLLAETYLRSKDFQKAVPLYADLFQAFIGDRKSIVNADLRKNYAIALGGTTVLENGTIVEYEGVEDYEKAKEVWLPIATTSDPQFEHTPIWWEAKYHIAYLDFKLGNKEQAHALTRNLEVLFPDEMRNSAVGPMFDWLKKKLQ